MRKILFILLSIIFSYLIIVSITYSFDFKIGDMSGYIYKNIITPLVGILVSVIILLAYKFKGSNLNYKAGLISIIIMSLLHLLLFNANLVGGWYLVDDEKVIKISNSNLKDLKKYLYDQNDQISYSAREEFIKRGRNEHTIILQELNRLKLKYGSSYVDMYEVWEYVEALSLEKDEAVLPYLKDMLRSDFSIEISYKGKIRHKYPARKKAKKLLKFYFKKTQQKGDEGNKN